MALHAVLKLKENSINPLLIKAGQRCSAACWPASMRMTNRHLEKISAD